ncbi:unnamed protein product [Lactuca saligna]|uniref:Replication protein A 70 kDa DNA-binding subunit B/D first OB fold domain-containing protein n=1 Tax=Lactuca saligna TaxID=75948 RepID=A0AA35YI77_LACSI|nr:unnamed protein product [Lactuca saligna]
MAAAATDLSFITGLDVLKDSFTMKLRVIRLWTLECYYNKDEIFSVEVILMEEQCNKIQGYVPNAYVYKFRKVLKEGGNFFIKNPNVAKIGEGKFRLTDQMQKLTFNRETTIIPYIEFSGSINEFALIDYHPNIFDNVSENISLDRRYVNTYYDVSKFIINSDIDKIKVFKKSLNEDDPHENSSSSFSYMKSNRISKKDEFLLNHELKTISDIFLPIEIKKYVIVADIKRILQNTPWFIISIRAQDHTGSITLTMFEQDAKKLLKISSKDLVAKTTKDVISQADDNVTPMNVFKSTATSPKKNLDATTGLKRALEDDFVLDVNDNMSSSKATKVVRGQQHKLVNVKLEK